MIIIKQSTTQERALTTAVARNDSLADAENRSTCVTICVAQTFVA